MTAGEAVEAIQKILLVNADRQFGPASRRAMDLLANLDPNTPWPQPVAPSANGEIHHVKASTFADPADVAAFRRCKAKGNSDLFCFGKGDNGIGFTGLDCTREDIPYVALPPEYWKPKFVSASAASGKIVVVTLNGRAVRCVLGDTMPHLSNITNGCGIDLAPGAQKAFGIGPGTYDNVTWQWA